MITIKSVEIVNFMSYGEEPVKVDFTDLGPTLIIGEASDEEGSSNGAGKSSIAAAILWCLFGRTINKDKPGDAVVNWFNKKDCCVKIVTTDGYVITRTRKLKGSAELTISKGGADLSASTSANAQVQIKKLFNLDYEIFTSCVFFGQLGKSFLELPDAKRRSILERVFNLHRINVWAEVAKEKISSAETDQAKAATAATQIEDTVKILTDKRLDEITLRDQYEDRRKTRIKELEADKRKFEEELTAIKLPDVDELKRKWAIIDKIQDKLNEFEEEKRKKSALGFSYGRDVSRITGEESAWKAKAGTTCPSCRQPIGKDHVASICEPFSGKKKELQDQIDILQKEITRIEGLISVTQKKVEDAGPKQTVAEAEAVVREAERIKSQVASTVTLIERTKSESNPHGASIKKYDETIAEQGIKLQELQKKVDNFNIILKHLTYIFSAYNDKKKLKSTLLGDLVPFLNERVAYYLSAFGCDFDLQFTPTLQDTTSRWDYEFHSGGERKRIDLAVMFAFYDLYVAIYGPQCNVVVLDEVDGRLDSIGVQTFVEVIDRDFTKKEGQLNRPDAVLIISHKDEMRDAFSSKIKVVKKDGFSTVEEVR